MGHLEIGLIEQSKIYRDAELLEKFSSPIKPLVDAAILGFELGNIARGLKYLIDQNLYDTFGFKPKK